MRYEVTDYTHSGHPEVAAQYSQGTFRTGQFVETDNPAGYLDDLIPELRREGIGVTDAFAEIPGGMYGARNGKSWTVEVTETDATLTVSHVCTLDEHDVDDCECWEYVHTLGLVEAPETARRTTGADGARFAAES